MAESYFSRTTFTKDQTQTGDDTFTFDFDYINQDDVKVSSDGVETSAFSLVDSSTVKLDDPLTEPKDITVFRETFLDFRTVDFVNAAELSEEDLDDSANQVFYAMQETYDLAKDSIRPLPDGSLTMSGRRLQGLGTPVVDTDATTQGWVKAQYTSGFNAHEEAIKAEAAREGAEAAEVGANDSATDALASEGYALGYKNEANDAKNTAVLSADEATLAKKDSELAASQAGVSADEAQTARNAADSYATNAATSASQADELATQYAGSTVGFDASAYDFGFINTVNTYFNRDFGGLQ